MFLLVLKYFSIIYCFFYSLSKILRSSIQAKYISVYYSILSFTLSFFIVIFLPNDIILQVIIIITILLLFAIITYKTRLLISFTACLISFILSYITLTISSVITSLFFTILSINTTNIPHIYFILPTSIVHLCSIYILFQQKRLQNGMPFIYKGYTPHFISFSFILIFTILTIKNVLNNLNYAIKLLILFLMFLLAIALLIWWRHKITQSYVEKLRVDEVELLYKEISDKDLEIEKLHAHNEQLSGIIHKDNKLIPAMEMAVRNYLQTAALMKPEDARQTGAELLSKLERMAEERTGIIHTYQKNFSYRQRSGLISIDAIVDYMENRASTLGIEYHYQFDKTLKEMLPAFITEDDAMHLLSDLIENAIIAASHSEKKNIHIHIGFIRSILFIDISDSGIPFTPETYEKFGNIQYTTHAEHGGSGIGLMDIAKLKKQYQFSLQIYEYPENETIYTKKIRILFDRKAHYLIQSYRAKELRSAILRNDLHVIPYSDKEKP